MIIQEGGNAFQGVTRINKENVHPTVDKLFSLILTPALGKYAVEGKSVVVLGSAGKKDTSGDIDVGVATPFSFEQISKKIIEQCKEQSIEFRILLSLKIITLKFPIFSDGDQEGEFVQIDLMVTQDLNYITWFNFSPDSTQSKYKGIFRNILLSSIAKEGSLKIDKNGIITRYSLSGLDGLNLITSSMVSPTGKQLKTPRIITKTHVTSDPQKISKLLLGNNASIDDTISFETVFDKMLSQDFPYKSKIPNIINTFKEKLEERGIQVPGEIKSMNESNQICIDLQLLLEKEEFRPKTLMMRSIPHIQNMTIYQLMEFLGDEFRDEDIEVAEKVDGANSSIYSPDGIYTYLKPKRARPSMNPNEFYDLIEKTSNDVFKGMGDFIKVMNNAGFPAWIKEIESMYKPQIDKLISKKSETKQNLGISIFGEIFNSNQMNTLVYSPETIGNGAWVVFGCVVRDGSLHGCDISTDKIGLEIMHEFVKTFNGSDGWKIYFKQLLNIKFNQLFIKGLQRFINEYSDIISSRKRNPTIIAKKEEARKKLETLLLGFKKDILKQIDKTVSFLGNTEIEGLVLRNMKTGAIVKIVDTGKFTEQNMANWVGVEELKNTRGKFVEALLESILKGADIFMLKGKQIEKLGDYLVTTGKKKFNSLDEVFDVLYKDASSEVQFDDARTISKNVKKLSEEYITDIHNLEHALIENQKDPKKKIDPKHLESTLKAINHERRVIEDFTSTVEKLALSDKNPLFQIIQYALGGKAVEQLKDRFVRVSK